MSSSPDYSGAASIQAAATDRATLAQKETAEKQLALQKEMYDSSLAYTKEGEQYNRLLTEKNQQNAQPYIDAGLKGLEQFTSAVTDPNSWYNKSFNGDSFKQEAGYQERLDAGLDSINKSMAARGGVLSGAAQKAALEYGQTFASNEYQNAYNRFNNDKQTRMNGLIGLTNYGVTGNQLFQSGSSQSNQGQQIAALNTNYGNSSSGIMQQSTDNINNLNLANANQQAQWHLQDSSSGGFNIQGAISGASAGSTAGPWGSVAGGVIGGFL